MAMRSIRAVFAAALAVALSFSAGAGETAILRVYTWSNFFDLAVLGEFEERHNCIVAIDTFDSNEQMLEDILAGAGEQYDIVTPSSYMAVEMRRRNLLRDFDHRLIPNIDNIDKDFAAIGDDAGMEYSVPYTRTVTGIGYRKSALGTGAAHSWEIFASSGLAGRMTMLDDVREALGAALKYLGYSLNTVDEAELAEAGAVLRGWRRNLAKYEVDESNIGLLSGEYAAVHGYNGDVAVVMNEEADISFFVPREGSAISVDDLVILSNAKRPDLAHAFVNHMLDSDVAARNMETILYYMPVRGALERLSPELRANPAFSIPQEILSKCELIRDVGADAEKYETVWRQIAGDGSAE